MLNPVDLLKFNRFDIPAKTIFAKFRENKYNSPWGFEVYNAHLKAWNGFVEILDNKRRNFNDFVLNFNNILDSIKNNGFDHKFPILLNKEGLIINGSHRLAAAITYNVNVFAETAKDPGREGQWYCTSDYFIQGDQTAPGNLHIKYLDAMAYEYCLLKNNTYIMTLFPSAVGNDDKIEQIISKYAKKVYKKRILFTNIGKINLIKCIYNGEYWIRDRKNDYCGAKVKVDFCYHPDGETRFYLIESDYLDNIHKIKEESRAIYNIDKHPLHINDQYSETLRMARAIFNQNSIHFLNNYIEKDFDSFDSLFSQYKNETMNFDPERICITASGVLAAYGIRDVQDIDFLYHCPSFQDEINITNQLIRNHNKEIRYYNRTIDDILFNPNNHFWYNNVKFASIGIISQLKKDRNEEKDRKDLEMIGTVYSG